MFVPPVLAKKILRKLHNRGHLGMLKLLHLVHFEWTTRYLSAIIDEVVQGCPRCQRRKHFPIPTLPLRPSPLPGLPWETIHIDYVTALNPTHDGYDAILTVVDAFTKFAIFIPAKKTFTAIQTARLLIDHVFSMVGPPKRIVSDKGTNLIKGVMPELHNWIGCESVTTSTNHPQTNGLAEKANKTIVDMIRTLVDRFRNNWPACIKLAQYEHNKSRTSSHRYSPFKALFAWDAPSYTGLYTAPLRFKDIRELQVMQRNIQMMIRENLELSQDEMAAVHDAKHRVKESLYEPGQWVLISREAFYAIHKPNWKMMDCFFGPFKCIGRAHDDNPNAYLIDFLTHVPKEYIQGAEGVHTVNARHIRPYRSPPGKDVRDPLDESDLKDRRDKIAGIAYIEGDKECDIAYIHFFMEDMPYKHTAKFNLEWVWELPEIGRRTWVNWYIELLKMDISGGKRLYDVIVNEKSPKK